MPGFLQDKANFGEENGCIEPEYVYYFYNNPPSVDWRYTVYDDEGAACSSYLNLHLDGENVQALYDKIEQFLSRENIHVNFIYILKTKKFMNLILLSFLLR